jgi:N-acetylglucosaminylphosphatidylinositol deacetylase
MLCHEVVTLETEPIPYHKDQSVTHQSKIFLAVDFCLATQLWGIVGQNSVGKMWSIFAVVGLAILIVVVSVCGYYTKAVLTNHYLEVTSFPNQYSLSDTSFLSSNEYSKKQLAAPSGNRKSKMRLLLFTAHPDDETMFFGPSLLSLAQKSAGLEQEFELYLHCLSKGMNCGDVRKKELEKASPLFSIPTERLHIDDLEDGDDWSEEEVRDRLARMTKHWNIDVILTFDSYGVSGHKNHRSCYRGTKLFLEQRMSLTGTKGAVRQSERNETTNISMRDSTIQTSSNASSTTQGNTREPLRHIYAYSLDSSSFLVKYSAWLFFPSFVSALKAHSQFNQCNSHILFSNPSPAVVHQAMLAHQSQYVWFRKIYILLSHYVFFNALSPINP